MRFGKLLDTICDGTALTIILDNNYGSFELLSTQKNDKTLYDFRIFSDFKVGLVSTLIATEYDKTVVRLVNNVKGDK